MRLGVDDMGDMGVWAWARVSGGIWVQVMWGHLGTGNVGSHGNVGVWYGQHGCLGHRRHGRLGMRLNMCSLLLQSKKTVLP